MPARKSLMRKNSERVLDTLALVRREEERGNPKLARVRARNAAQGRVFLLHKDLMGINNAKGPTAC